MRKRWSWVDRQEAHYAKVEADRRADAERRRADRQAFDERHEARAEKAEPIEVEPGHPDPESDGSYSLGDPEAAKVLRQLRLDAEAAGRAHAPGADQGSDD